MLKYGKVWGETADIFAVNNFALKRIELNKGFRCSVHKHNHKNNMFYVERGRIGVEVQGVVNEVVKGQAYIVDPEFLHNFNAIENSVCYEIYWANLKDIDNDGECGRSFTPKITETNELILFEEDDVELRRSYVSIPTHIRKYTNRKANSFIFVEKGELIVEVKKKGYKLIDITKLNTHDATIIPVGEEFVVKINSDFNIPTFFFVVRWIELKEEDIERIDVGGAMK